MAVRSTWRRRAVTNLIVSLCVAVSAAVLVSSASGQDKEEDIPRLTPSGGAVLSFAAQAGISAVLGRDHPDYHAVMRGLSLHMVNPRHQLAASFTAAGLEIRAGAARWNVVLRGYGYGMDLDAEPAVMPQAAANRVEFRRGVLTEWYVNGPLGLEQGFTLERAPGKRPGQPLTLAFAVAGSLKHESSREKQAVILTRADGSAAFRYHELMAEDATGRDLRTWLEADGQGVLLRVDDEGAEYPLVIDPIFQSAGLTASDGADGDLFGTSVSVSGETVVVGAYLDDIGANSNQGSAYVFVKPAVGWTGALSESAKLTASDGASGDRFGFSVGLGGDTIVVGASGNDIAPDSEQGAAYVFTKPAGGWNGSLTENAKLTASDGASFDFFGNAVAVSGDIVVVGAGLDDVGPSVNQGSAYVFVMPAGGWGGALTQNAELMSSTEICCGFFRRSAVSGETVVVGHVGANGAATFSGTAYLYLKPTGGWAGTVTENEMLAASDGAFSDLFGFSVAISGATVVAGAPRDDGSSGVEQGSAYVFSLVPEIRGLSASPSTLTPPNHRLVDVALDYAVTSSSPATCTPGVSSNEPIDGVGDGDSQPDWSVVDGTHLQLRAERSGTGFGRIYTVAITCTNALGFSSTASVLVTVPR